MNWLTDAEAKAYTDWKPCGLPETCQEDLDKHMVSSYPSISFAYSAILKAHYYVSMYIYVVCLVNFTDFSPLHIFIIFVVVLLHGLH